MKEKEKFKKWFDFEESPKDGTFFYASDGKISHLCAYIRDSLYIMFTVDDIAETYYPIKCEHVGFNPCLFKPSKFTYVIR